MTDNEHKQPSVLPTVGIVVLGEFTHKKECVRVFFRVEERKGSRLVLQILSELGKVPLLGLRSGTTGNLEVGPNYLPIRVTLVSLPWIVVETFAERAKHVHRNSLRVPAPFSVRFRPIESIDDWQNGKGVNISIDGLCFFTDSPTPSVGEVYQLEVRHVDKKAKGEVFTYAAEVRWIQRVAGGLMVGLHACDAQMKRTLVSFVSRLQHRLSRHPEDYLLDTHAKPKLE